MNVFDEVQKMARKCMYLKPAGPSDQVIGYWGGDSLVPSEDELLHWCSIHTSTFSIVAGYGGYDGWLKLSCSKNRLKWRSCLETNRTPLDVIGNCIALCGEMGECPPPIEAILLYGNDALQEWMDEHGIYDERTFLGTSEGRQLDAIFKEVFPLYRESDIFVQIGGWHVLWPESASYDQYGDNILLCTFHDSEPWVEVWSDNGRFEPIARIT